jgi:nicotinamide-nucleotide amidase
MLAEVISIGDELTSGQRLDTNSQWISERLGELGIRVMYHTTVADDLTANVEVFRIAAQRADVVIATGGLGPTADDLTREVLAQVVGRELVLNPDALAHITALFARRKRAMPERNVVQAMFPAGSTMIHNPQGTAPGIAMAVPRAGRSSSQVFALPGVPAELFEMWEASVAPALAALQHRPRVIRHRRIKCFGIGESDLEQMLPDLIRRGRDPQVGITVSGAVITLRITAMGADVADCEALIQPTVETIHECLGRLVYGEEEDELQDVVVRLLATRGLTLSTAEVGTAGRLTEWLAIADPDARQFSGGLVVASDTALVRTLGVPAELVAQHGANSAAAVQAMAEGCRRTMQTDLALAVGPLPVIVADAETPPRIHFAIAWEGGVLKHSAAYIGHSALLPIRAARQALDFLRLHLLD